MVNLKMKIKKDRIKQILILVFFLLTGLMISISKREEKQIVLELGIFTGSNWGVASANSFVIMDKAIAQFEKEHPNVKVHYTSGISKADYSEWCSQKLLEGNLPDLFMVLDGDFNLFCSLNVLKNLDPLINADPDFDQAAFFSAALDIGRDAGVQYALPYEIVPTLLFVNKSLLAKEKLPMPEEDWTWDDMYAICQKVTKDLNGDGLLDQFGTYNYNWRHAIYTSGGFRMDRNSPSAFFTDHRVLDALKYVKRLNDLNHGQSVTQEEFNQGNVAFMPLTFAEYRTYKTYPYRIKKYTRFQWDCITFPAGSEGENTSKVDALLIGINRHTRKEQLAWELLKQLTSSREMQMDIFRYSQGVSVLKDVTISSEAENLIQEDMDDGEKVISSQLLCQIIESGMIEPKDHQYEQIMSLADSEVAKILSENKNIDSSMKIFQRNINKYLQQQR